MQCTASEGLFTKSSNIVHTYRKKSMSLLMLLSTVPAVRVKTVLFEGRYYEHCTPYLANAH
jgi:hypothetical protein